VLEWGGMEVHSSSSWCCLFLPSIFLII
jgi:hypothetical protein